MKTLAISILSLTVSLLAVSFRQSEELSGSNADNTYPGFAVLELFTSEGCSSCPSAEALVAKIQQENKDKPVYILAFHVDYWNRLGWKDVFSDPAFTKRQRQYASMMKLSSVYTPQAVVDGETEFVGSKEATMRKAISESLNTKATARITFANVKTSNGGITFDYRIDGNSANTSIVLALVQKTAETKVRAGENAGRVLPHVQVTRNIQSIAVNGKNSGKASIEIPADLKSSDLEIISLLQNIQTGRIIAASRTIPAKQI